MVDLGPVAPWPFRYIPKTVVEGLELWHAAWERDHPDLLEPLGPSFYRPELDRLLLEREPWPVSGVSVAQAGAALGAAFNPGGMVMPPKPVPPPGPGAGSPTVR